MKQFRLFMIWFINNINRKIPKNNVNAFENRLPSFFINTLAFKNNATLRAKKPNVAINSKIANGNNAKIIRSLLPVLYPKIQQIISNEQKNRLNQKPFITLLGSDK